MPPPQTRVPSERKLAKKCENFCLYFTIFFVNFRIFSRKWIKQKNAKLKQNFALRAYVLEVLLYHNYYFFFNIFITPNFPIFFSSEIFAFVIFAFIISWKLCISSWNRLKRKILHFSRANEMRKKCEIIYPFSLETLPIPFLKLKHVPVLLFLLNFFKGNI